MVRQSPVSLSHKLQLPSSQVVTSTLSLCALLKSMSRRPSFSPLSPLHRHTLHITARHSPCYNEAQERRYNLTMTQV